MQVRPNPLPDETHRTYELRRQLYLRALALIIAGTLITTLYSHPSGSFLRNYSLSILLGWVIVFLACWQRQLTNQGVEILTYALGVAIFVGILLNDWLGWPHGHPLSFVTAAPLLSLWAFLAFGDKRGLQASLAFYGLSLLGWVLAAYPHWQAGTWATSHLAKAWGVYIFYYSLAPVYLALPLAMATLQRNLSRRRLRELQHLVYVDPLTELPNRRAFQEELDKAVEEAKLSGELGALILININNFAQINDEFGHVAGDLVLRQLAARWKEHCPSDMHLSRVSADEFAVILRRSGDADARAKVARLLQLSAEPIDLRGQSRSLSLRAGVTLFIGRETPNEINISADLAQAEARRHVQHVVIYTPELTQQAERRRRVLAALQEAQSRDEFYLVYQPIFDLTTGRLTSAEALLRWSSEATSPAPRTEEFIALAEEAGLMPMLGAWVLESALDQLQAWQASGLQLPHVNVNVAPQELSQSGYAQQVWRQLEARQLDPQQLVLELTERTMVEADTVGELQALRSMGVRIAVDDFGTGHSSLGQLHLLPITSIKLDRMFTRSLGDDRAAERLAGGVLALAKSLQLKVVAEGIETQRQLEALTALGCSYGQGYHLSRPLKVQAFTRLLQDQAKAEGSAGLISLPTPPAHH